MINQSAKYLLSQGLNLLLPPRCLACAEAVGQQGALCTACWENLRFISAPACACCGQPFAYAIGEGALCAACMATPPAYDHAVAVLRYDDASRRLITGFKYADKTHAARAYAAWMARAGRELLEQADVITPVPLHRRRLFSRRYNQAALLSALLARQTGTPHQPALLKRVKHTPPQASLSRRERRRNVRGAFTLHPKQRHNVAGKAVLLVDDVTTTGATVEACARALKKAGAAKVLVLTLAKTVIE